MFLWNWLIYKWKIGKYLLYFVCFRFRKLFIIWMKIRKGIEKRKLNWLKYFLIILYYCDLLLLFLLILFVYIDICSKLVCWLLNCEKVFFWWNKVLFYFWLFVRRIYLVDKYWVMLNEFLWYRWRRLSL